MKLAISMSDRVARITFPTFSTLILLFGLASNVVAAAAPGKDVSKAETRKDTPPGAKISSEQATQIALKVFPGKVTSVTIEKKRGKNVYTVEIMTKDKGEKDVFVDIVTGAVIGTD